MSRYLPVPSLVLITFCSVSEACWKNITWTFYRAKLC